MSASHSSPQPAWHSALGRRPLGGDTDSLGDSSMFGGRGIQGDDLSHLLKISVLVLAF